MIYGVKRFVEVQVTYFHLLIIVESARNFIQKQLRLVKHDFSTNPCCSAVIAPDDAKWEAMRSRIKRSMIFNGSEVRLIGL